MKILELIEQLEDLFENASSVPFSGKTMVNREEVISILKDMRLIMPDEVKQAQWITDERSKILEDAELEAKRIQKIAEQDANTLISDTHVRIEKMVQKDEITKLAEQRRDEIIATANQQADQIRSGAYDYADEIMQKIQGNIQKINESIEANRSELESYQAKLNSRQ